MGWADLFVAAKAKNDMTNSWNDTKAAWSTWYSGGVPEEQRKEREQRAADFDQAKQERALRKSKVAEQWAANRAANSGSVSKKEDEMV
ncbi:hypothetical protein ACA910_007146 [Epithemia clementina (nom. ined.)]